MTPWFSGDFQSIFVLVMLKSLLKMTRQSSRGKISNFVPKASESEFYIRILYIERGLLQLPFNHEKKENTTTKNKQTKNM